MEAKFRPKFFFQFFQTCTSHCSAFHFRIGLRAAAVLLSGTLTIVIYFFSCLTFSKDFSDCVVAFNLLQRKPALCEILVFYTSSYSSMEVSLSENFYYNLLKEFKRFLLTTNDEEISWRSHLRPASSLLNSSAASVDLWEYTQSVG